MIKKVTLALSIFSVFLYAEIQAQNVFFSGVGRALVTNDQLTDDTDPNSELKASGGYTLFDLGIYAEPNEVLRGGVILRVRNEFGGFFGDGASLEFRQLQMEGLIAKKVKYEFGDIYLTHTPYTLWNEEVINNNYEAGVFSMRRDIVNYENFYIGNAWRMQGFNAKSQLNFTDSSSFVKNIGIRAYGGRTMETEFLGQPDRYFYGGRLSVVQSEYFSIAGNLAGVTDIAGTVEAAEVAYDNMVYTTDFAVTLDKSEKFKFQLNGEAGGSHFGLERELDSVSNSFDDFFYDIGLEATYKPLNLTLGVSYRDVGFNFNSPMAQTRRWANPADRTLTTFSTMNDEVTARQMTVFDPYATENTFYNQSISMTRMGYYYAYDMVEPYGQATPNRRGLTINANIEEPEQLFNAGLEVNLLSEVAAEGDSVTQAKRDFMLVQGGFVFNFNKLIGFEKLIAINSGVRMESRSRGGTNPVDLSSTLIDIGLDVEVLKDIHLLGGAKLFNVSGSEESVQTDELNQIVLISPASDMDQKQTVIAAGVRYNYDNAAYLSASYHMVTLEDKEFPLNDFKLNQWFFVFGLKF